MAACSRASNGGFDLAAEWMGWDNVFHCEWNEFGKKVLNHYWPNAISYDDITKTDFTIHRGRIDILTGGFPCQPYSQAGKRLGKEDERHLWPEMLRAIREIAPRWVVGENVRGLTNWNGGMVFDEVQADLEACGYEVQPFLLPACAVNAPHRRDRIWFVAFNTMCYDDSRRNRGESERNGLEVVGNILDKERRYESSDNIEPSGCDATADTKSERLEGYHERERCSEHRSDSGFFFGSENKQYAFDPERIRRNEGGNENGVVEKAQEEKRGKKQFGGTNSAQDWWGRFPSEPSVCSGDDGIPSGLDGITFSKWRNESIKAYGNAVVPQVVYQIFKAIELYDKRRN